MSDELLAVIKGYENYEISSYGRVRRLTSTTCAVAGKILKTPERSKSRPYLCVDLCSKGKKKTINVHNLVADAFLAPPEFCGAEINHIDGDKRNPKASNLEWTTSSGNKVHSYEKGLQDAKGEKNGRAKLTDSQVAEIRISGLSVAQISSKYLVHKRTIQDILSRRSWRHI